MTSYAARRRGSGDETKVLALALLVVVAVLAPGLLTQAASLAGQLLRSLAVALGDLLHQNLLQPLLDSLVKYVSGTNPPAPPP